jgi:hypothetical protein
VMNHLGPSVDPYKDASVRRALRPLAAMAARTGVAVLLVRHLTKAPGASPMHRGAGSVGIIGLCRSAFVVGRDPKDPDDATSRRVMAPVKSNLSERPPAMAYRLESAANGSVRVVWDGASDITARDLVATDAEREARTQADEAADHIVAMLRADGPLPANDAKARVMRECGCSARTVDQAKVVLRRRGLDVSRREGFGRGGQWLWQLPEHRTHNTHLGRNSDGIERRPQEGAEYGDGPTEEPLL